MSDAAGVETNATASCWRCGAENARIVSSQLNERYATDEGSKRKVEECGGRLCSLCHHTLRTKENRERKHAEVVGFSTAAKCWMSAMIIIALCVLCPVLLGFELASYANRHYTGLPFFFLQVIVSATVLFAGTTMYVLRKIWKP